MRYSPALSGFVRGLQRQDTSFSGKTAGSVARACVTYDPPTGPFPSAAVAGRFRSSRKKLQRDRIQTVALAAGRRSVGKNVSQVAVAAFAANLGPKHPVADILNGANMVRVEGLEKARPTGSGFELGTGSKQRQAAQAATVHAVLFIIEQATAKGRLGPMVQ